MCSEAEPGNEEKARDHMTRCRPVVGNGNGNSIVLILAD